ncbi:tyrosine-type recombinase/integrase [Aequorivita marina]|uniref:tyrosine-type recombinase/integrase n=1 Tax=Aequorivita marina TaxID=3073654 RepID=UPI0028755D0A|nr:tyrosine-type recombinase/integrase [Aequorivita sp. S2608]MDS1297735.1 tyrosine-type recombinase/integrase [Aequorivita sp. S2608]
MDYSITYTLHKQRPRKNGKYFVRLQVVAQGKQKRYPTEFEYSEDEYNLIINPDNRGKNREKREQLEVLVSDAKAKAKTLKPFTIEAFEKVMYGKAGNTSLLNVAYSETINSLLERKKIGTANTYELSEKSIIDFIAFQLSISDETRKDEKNKKEAEKLNKEYKKLTFQNITPAWLQSYEDFMINRGRSSATVSMYLRCLRALFNTAINNEVQGIVYPFRKYKGEKNKYQIPKAQAVKKALTKEQLSVLFEAEALTPEQAKAKDFWFFSYACNGMNVKDIANLKYSDFDEDSFSFYRAKTVTTVSTKKKIKVYLNDFTRAIIEKYGSDNSKPNNLVFDIILKSDPADVQHKKISNFNCFISQNLKKLCKEIGLPKEISAYWARHSWATIAHNEDNIPLKTIMESLGHENIQTTQNYLNSFPDKEKKEYANNIMNFKR